MVEKKRCYSVRSAGISSFSSKHNHSISAFSFWNQQHLVRIYILCAAYARSLETHIQYVHAVNLLRGQMWTFPCSSWRFSSFPKDTVTVQHINFVRGLTLWPLGYGAVSHVFPHMCKMYNPQTCQQEIHSVKYVLWMGIKFGTRVKAFVISFVR